MRKLLVLIFSLLTLTSNAQQADVKNMVDWGGYTQLRFTSNYNDVNSFGMRRMKLWVNSSPGFNAHWGFRVQTTMTTNQNEKFMLQDVEAWYHINNFKINIGQFVPEFSLERFQSDASLPLTERSAVVNALVPDGTLGVRDIGIEENYTSPDKNLEMWLGVFNGNGINNYVLNNDGIMFTQKTAFHLFDNHLVTGYSLMYRKADQLQLVTILPGSISFSGNDFRYNLFAQYESQKFQLKSEYLWASLNGKIANGYYVLACLNLKKNQIVASWNQYTDLIQTTNDAPAAHLGYNYLFDKDKLKIMLDNGVQIDKGSLKNPSSTIQLQLFFN